LSYWGADMIISRVAGPAKATGMGALAVTSTGLTLLSPGDRLKKRYEIIAVHHVSGLNTLYVARDVGRRGRERTVAIKESLLDDGLGLPPDEARKAFNARAKRLVKIKHPGIARTYDFFLDPEHSYLVTEFIEGQDLESVLLSSEEPLSYPRVCTWGIAIAEALECLHSQKPDPIIYRDLKPSNIMLERGELVRLVDFGIADAFPHGVTLDPLGTDGYAAPEQYQGIVTPAIDIYALGATLHHLLTSSDPRLEEPFSFDRRPIRALNPAVPETVCAVIERALSENPEQRYPNASAMGIALQTTLLNT